MESRSEKLDVKYYKNRYDDILLLSEEEAKHHWVTFGFQEGRFCSELQECSYLFWGEKIDRLLFLPYSSDYLRGMIFGKESEGGRVGSVSGYNKNRNLGSLEGLEKEIFEAGFDEGFYLRFYEDLKSTSWSSGYNIYLHFKDYGKSEGRLSNLSEWLISNKLPGYFFPPKVLFLDVFKINLSRGIYLKLEDLLAVFNGESELPVAFFEDDKKNAQHYLTMARYYLQGGASEKSVVLLKGACSFYPSSSALELLGNIYMEGGHYRIALGYYNAARALQGPPKWLFINRAICLASLQQYEKALSSLAEGMNVYPNFTFQLDKLDELSENAWNEVYPALMSYIDQGDREQLIEASNAFADNLYRAYLHAAGCSESPALLPSLNFDRILIIGDFHVKQCERYRINQKIEQLQALGRKVSAIDWMQLERHADVVATHDVVIFYRVPAVPKVLKAMAQTNAAGKLSIYEIDDLIFDPAYPPALASYGGYVSLEMHRELTRGMALFHSAARNCRIGIASTEPLRERLTKLVFGKKCLLHRNGLDSLNTFSQPKKVLNETLDIFYGSGTQAHNQDFIELALPAIRKLLQRHTNLRLIIVGYLKLPSDFVEEFESQVSIIPPLKSVESYWSLLEKADINLAVLHDDYLNSCKSELKWFEAGCFGVPSVVSATKNYRDVINDGQDAFLAADANDWENAITQLVESSDLRREIGLNAQRRVKEEYSLEVLGHTLMSQLTKISNDLMEGASVTLSGSGDLQLQRRRRKVALVNVFFPPQSIGGATRVVADNFKALRKQYGDDFELVIFTGDSECRTPHQLSVYHYDGVRVYRATTLFREHMDWHPRDPRMGDLFTEFLECEQPDLVHFHCVQRLTGSVVEACRDAKIPYLVTAHDAWWISDFQFLVDHQGKVYPEGHPDPFELVQLPPGITEEASLERKMYLKGLLSDAEKVLTVSSAFADIYRKNGVAEIEVTPNGISDDLPWAPKDTSYTHHIVGGHVGGMAEHKGYFLLKKAVLEVQPTNMEFLIVDHSKEEGYEARDYWGNVPVRFVGRVSQDRIIELYRQIDVLFAPSTWPESFGLVTREAAACGCWVVASDLGGIGEDVEDNKNGNIIPPDVAGLKKVLLNTDKLPKDMEFFREEVARSCEQANLLASMYSREVLRG
ncbi:glycosyltransferase [Halomonas sp. I1]|uniref:glycosyltransferase n=1 Tax=Halomonas sp. I1 TaxID=393536 RepID=UPI0028DD909A|nr:glycosyltransferase [Halomonas sp. I1]MDT8893926.1 glycosyltransferase [Halomonas sp. I1]